MEIQFEASVDDYRNFIKAFALKRKLNARLIIVAIIAIFLGYADGGKEPFVFTLFLFKTFFIAIIFTVILVLIPYVISRVRLNKTLNAKPITNPKKLILSETGITATTPTDNIFWEWEKIKSSGIAGDYIFFILFKNEIGFVPIKAFENEKKGNDFAQILNFNIQRHKFANPYNEARKVRNLQYWGLLGFIPNFGLIAGIVLLVKAVQLKKVSLALVGATDVALTFVFWIFIFPILTVKSDGFRDISQMELNSLVKNIEFYKLQKGQYPDSLKQLTKDDPTTFINDPIQMDIGRKNSYFNYQNRGDKYLLFSSGADGIAGTKDDMYPNIKVIDTAKVHFVKHQ